MIHLLAKKTTSKAAAAKEVVTLKHEESSRKNIPTAEYESVMRQEQQSPLRVAYERRNRDLDPQLVWRGKDEQDWSDLVVPAPPLSVGVVLVELGLGVFVRQPVEVTV